MKFYLELIPFIGIYFGIICLVNLCVLSMYDNTKTPLKAVFFPLNFLLILYVIPFFIWHVCWMADLKVLATIIHVFTIFSVIPMSRCLVRPCRIHIWMVEKLLGSEHRHVAYLKEERRKHKWMKGC